MVEARRVALHLLEPRVVESGAITNCWPSTKLGSPGSVIAGRASCNHQAFDCFLACSAARLCVSRSRAARNAMISGCPAVY
jgi:hypothetical protein